MFIITFHIESECMLTPEHSIQIQNAIGADIIMQLDDVVKSTLTGPRVEEAMHRYNHFCKHIFSKSYILFKYCLVWTSVIIWYNKPLQNDTMAGPLFISAWKTRRAKYISNRTGWSRSRATIRVRTSTD